MLLAIHHGGGAHIMRTVSLIIAILVLCGCQRPQEMPVAGDPVVSASMVATSIVEPVSGDPTWVKNSPRLYKALTSIDRPDEQLSDLLGTPYLQLDYKKGFRSYTWYEHDSQMIDNNKVAGQWDARYEASLRKGSEKINALQLTMSFGYSRRQQQTPSLREILSLYGVSDLEKLDIRASDGASANGVTVIAPVGSALLIVRATCQNSPLLVEAKTDLSTGKTTKFASRNPNLVLEAARPWAIYLGPADINPFDPLGGKPSLPSERLPESGKRIRL